MTSMPKIENKKDTVVLSTLQYVRKLNGHVIDYKITVVDLSNDLVFLNT